MTSLLVHDLDAAWTSSDPAALAVTSDAGTVRGAGVASNRLVAPPTAAAAFAEFIPSAPLDLSAFDELRFWVRSDTPADGSAHPFYLEFAYSDTNDAPGEEHRWYVPVNRTRWWEQRRVGIAADRRSSVSSLRFARLPGRAFTCHVDELLAVREEMLLDAEQALVERLESQLTMPGLNNLPLGADADPGDPQIVLPLIAGFHADNRIRLSDGAGAEELHDVASVAEDAGAGTTTLHLAPGDPVVGTFPAATSSVSLVVPVLVPAPPAPLPAVSPCLLVTFLEAREDAERTPGVAQRDSFRPRGTQVVCSVRPTARAYTLDYQIDAVAPERLQQLRLQEGVLRRLSGDEGLRINGAPAPLWFPPAPPLEQRAPGQPAPFYLRIGTHMETAPRREQVWVRQAEVIAAQVTAPTDFERITLGP